MPNVFSSAIPKDFSSNIEWELIGDADDSDIGGFDDVMTSARKIAFEGGNGGTLQSKNVIYCESPN